MEPPPGSHGGLRHTMCLAGRHGWQSESSQGSRRSSALLIVTPLYFLNFKQCAHITSRFQRGCQVNMPHPRAHRCVTLGNFLSLSRAKCPLSEDEVVGTPDPKGLPGEGRGRCPCKDLPDVRAPGTCHRYDPSRCGCHAALAFAGGVDATVCTTHTATQARRGQDTCPGSHNHYEGEPGLQPRKRK